MPRRPQRLRTCGSNSSLQIQNLSWSGKPLTVRRPSFHTAPTLGSGLCIRLLRAHLSFLASVFSWLMRWMPLILVAATRASISQLRCDRLRGECGQGVADQFDWLSDEVGKPASAQRQACTRVVAVLSQGLHTGCRASRYATNWTDVRARPSRPNDERRGLSAVQRLCPDHALLRTADDPDFD